MRSTKFAILFILAIIAAAGLFAERTFRTDDQRRDNTNVLIVNVNVPGALVTINNAPARGYRFELRPAVYNITVRAPGFVDWNTTVNMERDQVLNVQLIRDVGNDRPQPRPHRQNDANLFINSNVQNAQVFIDDTLVGSVGATFTVPAGEYQLRVSAPGYNDFNTRIRVADNQTINAILTPNALTLTVNSNVPGAAVFVNDNQVGNAGSSFPLPPGTYRVRVSAPGYSEFSSNIILNGNQQITAVLNPIAFKLTVNSAAAGAVVFINNNRAGFANQSFPLPPGSYQLRIEAPGYLSFSSAIQLNGNQTVNAVLQAANGSLTVELPKNSLVLAWVDGARIKNSTTLTLAPGQHQVRFMFGTLVAESVVTVNQGQTVTVAPGFSVVVK